MAAPARALVPTSRGLRPLPADDLRRSVLDEAIQCESRHRAPLGNARKRIRVLDEVKPWKRAPPDRRRNRLECFAAFCGVTDVPCGPTAPIQVADIGARDLRRGGCRVSSPSPEVRRMDKRCGRDDGVARTVVVRGLEVDLFDELPTLTPQPLALLCRPEASSLRARPMASHPARKRRAAARPSRSACVNDT
jgi:hypothetical protein